MKESKHIGKGVHQCGLCDLGHSLALQFKSVRENNQIDALNTTRVQTLQNLLDETREQERPAFRAGERKMRKEVQSYREAAAGSSRTKRSGSVDTDCPSAVGSRHDRRGGTRHREVVLEEEKGANISGDEADYLIHDSDILSVVNDCATPGRRHCPSTATVFLPRRRSAAAGRWSPSTDGAPARTLC